MCDWKMRREEVARLISLYRESKCLWDYRSSEYKRTDLKRESWQNLSDIFGRPVDEIKKKVKHLRSSYVSEKKKCDEYFGVLPSYRPNLFYYDDMTFLDPIIVLRKMPKFEKFENADSLIEFSEQPIENTISEQYVTEEVVVSPPRLSPQRPVESQQKPIKKHKRLAPYYTKLNAAVNTLAEATKSTSEDSIYTSFGRTIALQLGQLSPLEATAAMSDIHQILSKNVIKSMMSKSRGMSSGGIRRDSGVIGQPETKFSDLIETVEHELEEDDETAEFDESL
ncbi:uncharacterized protein LOC129906241 [Episyrphus balteatus]|uniref:uncharacterized protein LOC129906241 n=1 Tax=Episyrphus balteatus TaxID=286459 RepID=UPI00248500EB|nr:uncharacterized protein LOC129906241 [Episyrphus balteatus]